MMFSVVFDGPAGAFERRNEAQFDWEVREFEVLRWRLVWGFANLGKGLCKGDRAFVVCASWLCSVDDVMFIKTTRTGYQWVSFVGKWSWEMVVLSSALVVKRCRPRGVVVTGKGVGVGERE